METQPSLPLFSSKDAAKSEKFCPRCKTIKSKIEFYKNSTHFDGLNYCCKPCHIQRVEELRDYVRHRFNQRKQRERKREKHPGLTTIVSREWRANNPDKVKQQWLRRDKSKLRAQATARRAVSKGTLTRPDCCSKCGKVGKVHGHHADYSKPLDVQWLCPVCHRRIHSTLEAKIQALSLTEKP